MEIGVAINEMRRSSEDFSGNRLQGVYDILHPRLEESGGRAIVELFEINRSGKVKVSKTETGGDWSVEMTEEGSLSISKSEEGFFLMSISKQDGLETGVVKDEDTGIESVMIVRPGTEEDELFVTRITPIVN